MVRCQASKLVELDNVRYLTPSTHSHDDNKKRLYTHIKAIRNIIAVIRNIMAAIRNIMLLFVVVSVFVCLCVSVRVSLIFRCTCRCIFGCVGLCLSVYMSVCLRVFCTYDTKIPNNPKFLDALLILLIF